ncbi:MAG TPA: ribosome biogenesis GTP-binding protein YihA/YsxC [Myxococcota bacterium]|nr:ribosome biogenesis GTP-binding protein YihA/YsxC [Myxococcota bacterium]HRY96432.1 ribosome biogenesis GTP-binding protein YihA/YsxC [Myxococcota bacterium]HSA23328.1 ribosome biogenesis GTP-binding protein YihA/YsxC [Myxococcota bacterium]
MRTYRAELLTLAPNPSAFPPPGPPEVAVVGRSNSGKSTLINTLMGVRRLARTAARPGKTRALVFFDVEGRFRLVDLPGYGYASVSRQESAGWRPLVEAYFRAGRPVVGVVALFDFRRALDDQDFALAEMLTRLNRPWMPVWTKVDKEKSRTRLRAQLAALDRELGGPAPGLGFSSHSRQGREELLAWLEAAVADTALGPCELVGPSRS